MRQCTPTQAAQLTGQQFAPDSYFNPIQDINNNWVIFEEEVSQCVNEEFMWVTELPQIEFEPKPFEM